MHRPVHVCRYCSRSFKRAEHLTRHLRTHTHEKPFTCQCGSAFTRRDLLTRHWRVANHAVDKVRNGSQDTSLPEESEHRLPEPVDLPNSDVHQPNLAAQFDVAQSTNGSTVLRLQDPTVTVALNELQHNPLPDEGFADFNNFVNFIDGVGLSAQWTPEYDVEWMRLHSERQPTRPASRDQEASRSPEIEDIGTPFSAWLPSAPADDGVDLRASSSEHVRQRSRQGPFHITEEHREFLVSLLANFSRFDPKFEIPSRHTLTRYITAFFGGFHSHFPYIHQPTYNPLSSPVELSLAMCAVGAQYCFEHKSSERLFHESKTIVLERLRHEEARFGSQTLAFAYGANVSPSTQRPHGCKGPWTPLDTTKTLLTLIGYATWGSETMLQDAFALRPLLLQSLRDNGLGEDAAPSSVSVPRSAMWDRWVRRESSRRTKLVAFCYLNVHSIAYNIHPLLWSSELQLRLPCCTPDWQASSATQWANLQRENKPDQMLFEQALSILLQGTAANDLVKPIPSPIGNYILLHALLQRIHVVRELSLPATRSASISGSELQVICRALRSWTSLWQQAPESTLDPNNESGPIPFTSSALLVVAYIRLSLNIGAYRNLDSRDPNAIAERLADSSDIERNENLLSALLYSTHALSIPVRLGIDRVARSQAFFWSVQHALSSFECAIFLSKWLCSLNGWLKENVLSRSEQRILHWVRCIIKEAFAVVDFDDNDDIADDLNVPEDPFVLGLAVLRTWIRFFKGNTQWQFVVNLGLSLERYVEVLKCRLG